MSKSLRCCLFSKANERFLAAALAALLPAAACPARLRASGYEFDGVGARAIARGGAVIADASDWTAVYWNPANLAALKRAEAGLELKAGKSYSHDGNSFNAGALGNPFGKKRGESAFLLGSAGAVVPLRNGSVLGFGVYTPLLQGANFTAAAVPPLTVYRSLDYKGFAAIGIANFSCARRLTDGLSGAAGIDFIYGRLKTSAVHDFAFSPLASAPDVVRQDLDGEGYGFEGVFGGKYEVSDVFSLGAVFRSGSKVVIRGEAAAASGALGAQASDFRFTLKHPPTSGVGCAWQYRESLKLTLDFTQTWWRGFSNAIDYRTDGLALLPDQPDSFRWKNSYKLRAGLLWNRSENTDYMFGYAYDTPAIDAGSIDFSSAIDVHMHRVSAAVTRRWGDVAGTLAGLAGYNEREAGGVDYSLGGCYLIGEMSYRF